jgi:putative glutamine amidotransferase
MTSATSYKIRVGIPYRTRKEELSGERAKYDWYVQAVKTAGAEPVPVSLALPPIELKNLANSLDAIVLTGSPSDVDPSRYRAERHPRTAAADPNRECTDFALLDHAFTEHKPVLAICYGVQSLNVFLGGSLVQHVSSKDSSSEIKTDIPHPMNEQTDKEFRHLIQIEPGTRLAQIGQSLEARVNSSHHQAIKELGRGLRVMAHAPDGVVEGVEWTGDADWVTGVQWHPERMHDGEPLAGAMFRELMAATRRTAVKT